MKPSPILCSVHGARRRAPHKKAQRNTMKHNTYKTDRTELHNEKKNEVRSACRIGNVAHGFYCPYRPRFLSLGQGRRSGREFGRIGRSSIIGKPQQRFVIFIGLPLRNAKRRDRHLFCLVGRRDSFLITRHPVGVRFGFRLGVGLRLRRRFKLAVGL